MEMNQSSFFAVPTILFLDVGGSWESGTDLKKGELEGRKKRFSRRFNLCGWLGHAGAQRMICRQDQDWL